MRILPQRPVQIIFGLAVVLSCSILMTSFAQTDSAQTSTPVIGDALVTASIGEPSTLVPILAADAPSHDICGLVFNSLLRRDRDLQFIGELARSWAFSDDGLTLTFHLRQDVRWHDGQPFTAEDVLFTFKKYTDPKIPTPYGGDFEQVESVQIIDPFTIEVRYKQPFAPALSSWGKWIVPKHLLENEDLMTTSFKEHPIGTGPFRFHRWIRGDRIELAANPDYFEGRPYLQHYIYRIIPDQSTIFLELQAQGIDQTGLSPLQYDRMTDTQHFKNRFRKFRYPSLSYTYLGYNLRDPRFSDIRVRQAFNFGINRQEIIDGVLFGLGKPATGPFPQKSWAYDTEVQPAPFDPERAAALLREAGWIDSNQDGILDKEGESLSFTILTNQGNLPRKLAAQIIEQRLRKLGVDVEIRFLEWSAFLEFIHNRKFEAVLLGWGLSWEPDPYDIWHSSKTAKGEFNFIGYENSKVDALLDKGRSTLDQTKREAIYHEIHRILYEEQPVCFLYVPDATPVLNRRFEQVELSPFGGLFNLIHWTVPEEKQRYHLRP